MQTTVKQESREPSGTSPVDHEVSICSGYGACSKSGCNCQAYEGSAGTCGNRGCGHAFEDHW